MAEIKTDNSRQIVLASGNKGKLAELQKMLNEHSVTVQLQSEFGIGSDFPEAEETGLTFVENAIIKARYGAKVTGLPVIADDSGLEVDHLNGQPGIYSARYSGTDATDSKNNLKLLENLTGVPQEQRTARFHCVLVYMRHAEDPTPAIFHGSWEGRILEQLSGEKGFGYDPLFFVESEGCTAAEMSSGTKNKLSHRGKAMAQLKDQLRTLLYTHRL
ncbi:non-canonical purine NTP pyrophosphatase, RdgB/HAM1 family [Endozoicomonas sp. (ex Bugula neritina AB1)]|nr:non-canonical purine NTP pyrophosphatase, RdgB/HAM1 family [Endozoicomonas sp. (ex Bugula neritina AB1)]